MMQKTKKSNQRNTNKSRRNIHTRLRTRRIWHSNQQDLIPRTQSNKYSSKRWGIITINDINIYAGDLDENEEIEIEDLTSIIENYGTITDDNKAQKAIIRLKRRRHSKQTRQKHLKSKLRKNKNNRKWVDPNPPAKSRKNKKSNKTRKYSFITKLCRTTKKPIHNNIRIWNKNTPNNRRRKNTPE